MKPEIYCNQNSSIQINLHILVATKTTDDLERSTSREYNCTNTLYCCHKLSSLLVLTLKVFPKGRLVFFIQVYMECRFIQYRCRLVNYISTSNRQFTSPNCWFNKVCSRLRQICDCALSNTYEVLST